ncbi:MAG: glycosyltransferase [Candidatus Sericytochromatia bacterium]
MTKTLSLCIITKDCHEYIRDCFESVKHIVDEIIVVDTGSIDHTKKIAPEYKAKVYDFKWNNDFSEARNFALSKVTTDWVLILDSDEILKIKNNTIKDIINKDYGDITPFYFLDIFTYTKKGHEKKPEFYQKKIRLFPKTENIKFIHPIYEEIIHPLGMENIKDFSTSDFSILHFQKGGQKEKSKRNVLILKEELKKNQKDFYMSFYMGKECLYHDLNEKALKYYQNALEVEDDKDEIFLSEICTDIIELMYKNQNIDEALNECIRREKLCEPNYRYWYLYGYITLLKGDYIQAKKNIEKCLSLQPPSDKLIQPIDMMTWKPYMILGYISLRLKEYAKAKECFEKCIEYNKNHWLLLFYLSITYKEMRDYTSSEEYLNACELIVPEEYRRNIQFTMLLMNIMSGNVDKANEIIVSIVKELEEENELQLQILDYDE